MKRIIKKRTGRVIRKKRTAILILLLGFFLCLLSLILSLYINILFKEPFHTPISKSKYLALSDLESILKKKSIKYQKISWGGDLSSSVSLDDGGVVVFTFKKDLTSQISSLQLILSRLTIEGKRLKKLDFRFTKPVIELM